MTTNYQETEMSKKARKILERIAKDPWNELGKLKILRNPFLTATMSERANAQYNFFLNDTFKENRNPKSLYRLIGDENQEINLLTKTIELNLTEEEVHGVIKERYIFCYGPESMTYNENGLELTKKFYPEFCNVFEINPDENFPDWKL